MGFDIPVKINSSGVPERPPDAVLQSVRILVRKDTLSYKFQLDEEANYLVIAYFARILPVKSSFHVLVNGDILTSNYTLQSSETCTISSISNNTSVINITIQNVSSHPQINALEVYQIADIPLGSSQSQGRDFQLSMSLTSDSRY